MSDSDLDFSQSGSPMSAKEGGGPVIKTPSFSLLTLKSRQVPKITRRTSPLLRHRRGRDVIPALGSAANDGGQPQLGVSMLGDSEGCTNATPSRVRVLLADDDATQRNSLLQILVGEGFEVDAVGDGSEALSRTARVAYDAVLMDGFMPGQVLRFRSKAALSPVVDG